MTDADATLSQLSAHELLECFRSLQNQQGKSRPFSPEETATKLREVRAEFERRVEREDADVFAIADANLKEWEQNLLPIPAELISEQIGRLSDRVLVTTWQTSRKMLDFERESYSDLNKVEDEFDRATLRQRRVVLEQNLDRVAREMLRRSLNPHDARLMRPRQTAGKKKQPDVTKRRSIVKSLPRATDLAICKRFDLESVPTPWIQVTNWMAAYGKNEYRSRIHTLISKDRAHGE